MLISKAAAKLILAGEHGVLYGVAAITTPIYWYTRCYWQHSGTPAILLGDHVYPYTEETLAAHWQHLCQRQVQWQHQPSTQILTAVKDLPLMVLAWWQRHYPLAALYCRIESDIPLGSGLGSSASVIIALLRGLADWHGIVLTPLDYQQIATELEGFAHGRSSGLDVRAILSDTCTHWHMAEVRSLLQVRLTGYLVHTGQPESQTADCVRQVRQTHAQDTHIWQQMQQGVDALALALTQSTEAKTPVRQLQGLLTRLGVVPERVQRFTSAIEARGWAGKLCGAGSISGHAGGFYWLLADTEPRDICAEFHYPYWTLDHVSTKSHS